MLLLDLPPAEAEGDLGLGPCCRALPLPWPSPSLLQAPRHAHRTHAPQTRDPASLPHGATSADRRRRNRPSCPTPALHSPDTALARAFLACFIHLQNSFLRPQKTRTVPPAHARSERARPASGRVLGMRRDRGETSCKQPSMRKKSNNW